MTAIERQEKNRFPRQASAIRGLLHLVVALVGWAVFIYWWWIVFGRVSRREVVFTGIFIAVTTVVSITLTAIWSLHNKNIHRRRGARSQVRPVHEDYSRDTLLRTVSFLGSEDQIKGDPLVQVLVSQNKKVYHPSPATRLESAGPLGRGKKGRERASDDA